MKRQLIVSMGLILLASAVVPASTISIGVLSFDVFVAPANGSPGLNAISISEFTGIFDLPPDFPVITALAMMNATLTVEQNGGLPQAIPLGNIGPGPLLDGDGNPLLVLQFPSTTNFTSATFMATLGPTTFALSDGSTFVAGSAVFATLSPSSGSLLVAGIDNVPITAQSAATVPEPGTWIFLGAGLTGVLGISWKKHSKIRRLVFSSRWNKPMRSSRYIWLATAALLVRQLIWLPLTPVLAQTTVTLSSPTSPSVGQAGITNINVTGSGFPTGSIPAANVTVTLRPTTSGPPNGTTTATAVTTVVGTTRRISFTIPASIAVSSPTPYTVSVAGISSDGTTFSSGNTAALTVNPSASISSVTPNSGQVGQTISVNITGLYTNFVQGATQANFGAGISVGSGPVGNLGPLAVTSPTAATAQLTISTSAATGSRTVTVVTGAQQTSAPNGFTVMPATVQNVTVPNVVGLPQATATSALIAANLTLGIVTQQTSMTVPPGSVISESPVAGALVPSGSPVNLVVSQLSGPPLPPDPSTVAPPLDASIATTIAGGTSFLYTGATPIQTGVAPNTIMPVRAAVLRGKVLDKTNAALSGVTITVLNHPEFGQTLSRADGMFDMAVNGGGPLTLNYAKTGLLSAQRQVQVPWQNFALAPDVILIPLDNQVTAVNLTGLASMQLGPPGRPTLAVNNTQVARGSAVTDSDGSRQATLIFQPATQAAMLMPDGSTTPLSLLHVRATEYTVGSNGPMAMPAALPPTSAYTYAVELSADEAIADGASSVTFNKPVLVYVENFLRFPVGIGVPLGGYNKARGIWVGSDNGRVVKILSITAGLADLDTTGNGTADNGVTLGVTVDERQQLAGLYSPGQTLWRMAVDHFSPWDCNWPYAPPPDAAGPDVPDPTGPDERDDPVTCEGGSSIDCQNQTLGESIRLTGTPLTLNYRSDRVPGRKDAYTLGVQLSGASIPASLKAIALDITVAGQTFHQEFPPAPNLTAPPFHWNGKDVYGRQLQGLQTTIVRVGYVYQALYAAPGTTTQAFAIPGGIGLVVQRPQQQFILYKEFQAHLGIWDESRESLGAWSLNVHHEYEVVNKALYLGDGSRRSSIDKALSATITTFAGNGLTGFGGDGGIATAATLNLTSQSLLAAGPDGGLYIADAANNRIRRVAPNGIISTVAGTGTQGFGGDGGPATGAALNNPDGLALGPDGSLYIADRDNLRIRRVGLNGIITTFAGTGSLGFSGDGGPATAAALFNPSALAIGPDGSLYIVGYSQIRRVGPNGIITTFAGTTGFGFSGDGGPAIAATLFTPSGLAVGSDGSLYIADSGNLRIRRVGPDGIITTFAGTGGGFGFGGDGGSATAAMIGYPSDVALGLDGSLYIADFLNGRIRRVGPDGIITTFAGTGDLLGDLGDGGPAVAAFLHSPVAQAVGPDGSLYIADAGNERIRKVASLPGFQLSDILIGAQDGSEVYVFNGDGLHQRTLSALTSAVRYQFAYDSKSHLTTVTDGDGNVTVVDHDANGNPTAIVAPFGQRTTLTVDANGYLASVTDPAGGAFRMSYTPDGLLMQFTDPNRHTSAMTYDGLGRLTRDADAAGGSTTLIRTDAAQSYTVSLTTALNRTTAYQIQSLSTGNEQRVNTFPDGTQRQLLIGTDGSRKTTLADGSVINLLQGPDPRFGMQTPLLKSLSTTTGGLTFTLSAQRSTVLADPLNPLSLTNQTDKITINGHTLTSSFDVTSKTFTNTSAAGRQSMSVIDGLGRVTRAQVPGFFAANLGYDSHGRLATVIEGTGSDKRTVTFDYNSDGYLQAVTDPLGRSLNLQYDAAGRVTRGTLADGRAILYGYDANGNLNSVVPPGRPAHTFSFTPVDLTSQYTPPLVPDTGNTVYTYNADRQLTLVTRPDNKTVHFSYDSAGRLNTLTLARGVTTYAYSASTGQLSSITAPDGGILSYGYSGSLLTTTAWHGEVSGIVARTYDDDFLVTSLSVNGKAISFDYDADNLLTQAGGLKLTRDSNDGVITGTALGNESETLSYNGFGELTGATASYSATPLLSEQYVRDQLGRITRKVETLGGTTTTFDYTYDLAGHLVQVGQNGIATATYSYDSNSNLLSANRAGSMTIGSYDSQDRVTQYGSATYTYSPSGELQTKADGGQTTSYSYDELGNLLKVTLPDKTLIEYVIDGRSRRIGKKVGGVLTRGFLYQNSLNPISELDAAGNVVSQFVYASHSNVPDYMLKNGNTYRIITDELGSPRIVIDVANGTIAQRMDYDESGRVTLDSRPGFQPFGFAGGLYDQDTGLVRFGVRDYDSETRRWTTKDPIGLNGGDTNLYAYVHGDPVSFKDPSGRDWKHWKQWLVSRILSKWMKWTEADTPDAADKPDPSEQAPPPKPETPEPGAGGNGKGDDGGGGGGNGNDEKDKSCDPNARSIWDPLNPWSPLNPLNWGPLGPIPPPFRHLPSIPPIPDILKPLPSRGPYAPVGPPVPIELLLEGLL